MNIFDTVWLIFSHKTDLPSNIQYVTSILIYDFSDSDELWKVKSFLYNYTFLISIQDLKLASSLQVFKASIKYLL